MPDTILGDMNGLKEAMTADQNAAVNPLFGPEVKDIRSLLEKIQDSSKPLGSIDKSINDIQLHTSSMNEVLNEQKDDFKKKGKLKVTNSDLISLRAPYSFGFMYLGNILSKLNGTFNSGFSAISTTTAGVGKNVKKSVYTKSGDGLVGDLIKAINKGKEKADSIKKDYFLVGLKESLAGAMGVNNLVDAQNKGGLLGMLGSAMLGSSMQKSLAGGISTLIKGSKIFKFLSNPITMIASSIIMFAIDGIKGAFSAKKWGTSKFSGILGGILGGTSKGTKGAFKNMGKWALMGAGIGTAIMPGVGTIAGGIIGAAIGGILGAIGGEKIAKGFQKLGDWFKDSFTAIGDWFKNSVGPFFKNLPKVIGGFFVNLWNIIIGWFGKTKENIGKWIGEKWADLKKGVINIASKVGEFFKGVFTKVGEWVSGVWDTLKETFLSIISAVGTFFSDIFTKIGTWVSDKWEDLKTGFFTVTSAIGTFFGDIFTKIGIWVNDKWEDLKTGFFTVTSAIGTFFGDIFTKIGTWAKDKWEDLKVGFFTVTSAIGTFFGDIFTKIGTWASDKWEDLKVGFFTVTSAVGTFFGDTFTKVGEWALEKWDTLKTGFINVTSAVGTFFGDATSKVADWALEKWDTLKTGFSTIATGVKDWLAGTAVGKWGAEKVEDIKSGFTTAATAVKDWLAGTAVGKWGAEKVEDIKSGFETITKGVKGWLDDQGITVETLAEDPVNTVKTLAGGIFTKVKDWFSNRSKEVEDESNVGENKGFFTGFMNKVKGLFNFEISPTLISDFIREKLFKPITDFFDNIGSFFKFVLNYFNKGEGGLLGLITDATTGQFDKKLAAFRESLQQPTVLPPPEKNKGYTYDFKYESDRTRNTYKTQFQQVEDGIFGLQKSLGRGALFNENSEPVMTANGDDLYLMASTNPARDALADSVDKLGELIAQLASAIATYRPQVNNTLAPIQSQENVMRTLLARG